MFKRQTLDELFMSTYNHSYNSDYKVYIVVDEYILDLEYYGLRGAVRLGDIMTLNNNGRLEYEGVQYRGMSTSTPCMMSFSRGIEPLKGI